MCNCPHGALVFNSLDKRAAKTMNASSCLADAMAYLRNGTDWGWDLILPKKADKKWNYRLRNRRLTQCE